MAADKPMDGLLISYGAELKRGCALAHVSSSNEKTTWRFQGAMIMVRQVEPLLDHNISPNLLSASELADFDGRGPSGRIYLAILGEVYDVTAGAKFYGPDSGSDYSIFAGQDASRVFVTGEFKSSSQPVNFVEDFDEEQMLGLEHWRLFYAEHVAYPYVGRVFGSGFFDEHGEETPLLKKINNVIKEAEQHRQAELAEEKLFPACNSKWRQHHGGHVWCADGRVPREGSISEHVRSRCACYTPVAALQHRSKLRVLPGCEEKASKCNLTEEHVQQLD